MKQVHTPEEIKNHQKKNARITVLSGVALFIFGLSISPYSFIGYAAMIVGFIIVLLAAVSFDAMRFTAQTAVGGKDNAKRKGCRIFPARQSQRPGSLLKAAGNGNSTTCCKATVQ